eukprot:4488740-Prorocentrum_lima.AAC.1
MQLTGHVSAPPALSVSQGISVLGDEQVVHGDGHNLAESSRPCGHLSQKLTGVVKRHRGGVCTLRLRGEQ